jgi:hypothetical protein
MEPAVSISRLLMISGRGGGGVTFFNEKIFFFSLDISYNGGRSKVKKY